MLVVFLNLCVGGVLVNIYICDIFFDIIESDIASFAGDNAPCNLDFSLDNVIRNLDKSTNSLLNRFRENRMKATNTQHRDFFAIFNH